MISNSFALPGYEVTDLLYDSPRTQVYRGVRLHDHQLVIIKLLKRDYPTVKELFYFRHQFTIIQDLHLPQLVKPLALLPYQRTLALVMEDEGLVSLLEYKKMVCGVQKGLSLSLEHPDTTTLPLSLPLDEFFPVAIQLTEILDALYQKRVIHKDIKPQNILIHPTNKVVKLSDFKLASRLPKSNQQIQSPNVLEGTLAYMSPEQTSRMNRGIDYRSDYYSLGVTFYELLTGQLPFFSSDPMELVYYHLARQPIAPSKINPSIPPMLDGLILKLMAKRAEERYQTAYGIKYDLMRCQELEQDKGTTATFELASQDINSRFVIPETLYGREGEVAILLQAFSRVAQGSSEVLLVAGYSGIGKSALVHEIHKPITRQRGYFLAGKFDQFNRGIAYKAISRAFQELVQQLLAESEEQLTTWRKKLLAALAGKGQVICDVIPEVELIMGKQPALPQLGAAETQNRFHQVFQDFITVFTQAAHPLVLFLDDLQWADSATLRLLKELISNPESQYLLFIGAYRDNEVDASHPFIRTMEEIKQEDHVVQTLTLNALDEGQIKHLLADTLKSTMAEVASLARLVKRKTEGNPFFANQFLKMLYQEQLLSFNVTKMAWQWDMAEIEAKEITDNVVELMVNKIKKLPHVTQMVLQLGACIGNSFKLSTLSVIYKKSFTETAHDLWPALRKGLLLPVGEISFDVIPLDYVVASQANTNSSLSLLNEAPLDLNFSYRFLHDRVQQAAYRLIEPTQVAPVHLEIGRLLLQNRSGESLDDTLFDVVAQLNAGGSLIEEQEERIQLAKLNKQAGLKAKTSAAYQQAASYFAIGVECLPASSWQTHYELTFTLYKQWAEVAYLSGKFEQADQIYPLALQQAQHVMDKASLYFVQMDQYQVQGRYDEAISIQRASLRLLGWDVPQESEPLQRMLQAELAVVDHYLAEHEIEALLAAPKMSQPEKIAMVDLLQRMFYAAYLSGNQTLANLTLVKMTTLSLQNGNCKFSPFGYVGYGLVVGGLSNDYETGYRFGKMAIALCDQFDNIAIKCKANFLFAADVHNWNQPIHASDPYYDRAYELGIECGDWPTVGYAIIQSGSDRLTRGKNLSELYKIGQSHLAFLQRSKNYDTIDLLTAGVMQPILNLQGLTNHPHTFNDGLFDEDSYLESYAQLPYYLAWLYYAKIRSVYLFEDRSSWLQWAEKVSVIETFVPSHSKVPETFFYTALIYLAHCDDLHESETEAYFDKVATLQERMVIWLENCPENIEQKQLLIEAEKARLRGKRAQAMDLYEAAIDSAKEHHYINNEALANELYAKFWLQQGREKFAQLYLREAVYHYEQWGAYGKVEQLKSRYRELLGSMRHERFENQLASQTISGSSLTVTSSNTMLDWATVMKASQALSEEIQLDRLLSTLMQVVSTNMGAQKAALILPDTAATTQKETPFVIEALAHGASDASGQFTLLSLLEAIPVEESDQLPRSIIHYVARTQKALICQQALVDAPNLHDPYLLAEQPKSILCTPIIHQAQLIGILYLENNLATRAFTTDRLQMIQLLTSQAAISLENARLYASVEQKVAERTAQLQAAKREAELAREEAEEANRAKSAFLANMSHELRTPLNAILGFSQLMRRHPLLPYELMDNLGIISRSGEHLLTLINNVLDLSKIEAGRTTLNEKEFDLYQLLDDLEDMFALRAEQKELRLLFERVEDLPHYIYTDPVKLRQVLINLLNNALKFTKIGGVSLRMRMRNQNVSGTHADLEFEVQDTGVGIDADEAKNLFQAFMQTRSGRQSQEGTGLGLAISQQFIHLMKGNITARSQVGVGTIFKFHVQVGLVATDKIKRERGSRHVIGLAANQPHYRILIVDDQYNNRQLLMQLLGRVGFAVQQATHGQEAIEIWQKWSPHFIWMDLRMPVMDGYDATRHIKKEDKRKQTTIVALTASSFQEEQAIVKQAGFDDFMRKPFREAEIFTMMHKHLGVRYIYQQDEQESVQQSLTEAAIMQSEGSLTLDWLNQLQEALEIIDLDQIFMLIDKIRQTHSAVAKQLEEWVNDFEYEPVFAFITQERNQI